MIEFIFARVNGKYYNIPVAEIRFIEAKKNYVRIVTGDQSFLAHVTLSHIEKKLPQNLFCRIHRSYIVAISKVKWFDCGYAYLNLKDTRLPISTVYFELLKTKVLIVGAGPAAVP